MTRILASRRVRCARTISPSPAPSGFDRDAFLRDCQRVPVIYRYTPGQDKLGQRMSLPGEDRAGFVGAIAWIGKDRALAVGGSGVYPRREQPAGDPQPDRTGVGRAWLYDHGSWQEIDLAGKQTTGPSPRPMGGLTALDCSPFPRPTASSASPAATASCGCGTAPARSTTISPRATPTRAPIPSSPGKPAFASVCAPSASCHRRLTD